MSSPCRLPPSNYLFLSFSLTLRHYRIMPAMTYCKKFSLPQTNDSKGKVSRNGCFDGSRLAVPLPLHHVKYVHVEVRIHQQTPNAMPSENKTKCQCPRAVMQCIVENPCLKRAKNTLFRLIVNPITHCPTPSTRPWSLGRRTTVASAARSAAA